MGSGAQGRRGAHGVTDRVEHLGRRKEDLDQAKQHWERTEQGHRPQTGRMRKPLVGDGSRGPAPRTARGARSLRGRARRAEARGRLLACKGDVKKYLFRRVSRFSAADLWAQTSEVRSSGVRCPFGPPRRPTSGDAWPRPTPPPRHFLPKPLREPWPRRKCDLGRPTHGAPRLETPNQPSLSLVVTR